MKFFLTFVVTTVLVLAGAYFMPGLGIVNTNGAIVAAIFIALANTLTGSILSLRARSSNLQYVLLSFLINILSVWAISTFMYGLTIYNARAFILTVIILTAANSLVHLIHSNGLVNLYGQGNKKREILAAIIGMIIMLFLSQAIVPKAGISGTIIYNGLLPEDAQNAEFIIMQHEYKSSSPFKTAVENIPIGRRAEWRWDGALEGKTYQLKAYVEVAGKRLSSSNVVLVSAPARSQVLIINTPNINFSSTKIIAVPKNSVKATVSGVLDINGYVPDGSTVTLFRKNQGERNFQQTATVPAEDGRLLEWTEATPGEIYTYDAVLNDPQGNEVMHADSAPQTVIAPSTDNTIIFNSPIQPPSSTSTTTGESTSEVTNEATISGTLQINGPIPQNSEVVMYQKLSTEPEYESFATYDAANEIDWKWEHAVTGSEYKITSALQVNGETVIWGDESTAVAPAANQNITVNTGVTDGGGGGEGGGPTPTPTTSPIEPSATAVPETPTAIPPTSTTAPTQSPSSTPILTPSVSPTPSITPTPTPATCSVNYNIRDDWGSGMTVDVQIKNISGSEIKKWDLEWDFSGNQVITNLWDGKLKQTGTHVAVGDHGYNQVIPPNGGTQGFGFNANYSGTNDKPGSFNLNGAGCSTY